ncbi:MAG TPA: cobalt-precorrin-5B (C(1))-methyltransferase [Acidimicrobiales bacterium]|nr:cobalt-precorrin-5B (C(1))-methyltransferase [Acidimicrobiales bacterium]
MAETQGLRTGWTTGTCASAAAKAAATALVHGQAPDTVEVALPSGQRVRFPVEMEGPATCVVVKDAGDDPDCTNGARLTATAAWGEKGVALVAGPGVGTITRPGLGLAIGLPAINPVPRRMILGAVAEVTDRPLRLTFSVPHGQAMAAKTSNSRLGIVGGISILGTTGIVRPFSTAAYRASVVQQVDVAAAQGSDRMVLATGSRSEQAALRLFADLSDVCIVEVGDFTGICLRRVAQRGMRRATFVGMTGKITKLAAGVMMTHFHRSKVDTALLAEVATEAGAPPSVVAAATETETARHFFDACVATGCVRPLELLCRRAARACRRHVNEALDVDVLMVDFEGYGVVARG